MGSKSIYLTPFKGRLTAFNLFESLKVGNLLSILLLLNWWQYSYLPLFAHEVLRGALDKLSLIHI